MSVPQDRLGSSLQAQLACVCNPSRPCACAVLLQLLATPGVCTSPDKETKDFVSDGAPRRSAARMGLVLPGWRGTEAQTAGRQQTRAGGPARGGGMGPSIAI
jgi:hypothetical protein